jgi:hypothetical protein
MIFNKIKDKIKPWGKVPLLVEREEKEEIEKAKSSTRFNFKVGDWCFHEFELKQIEEIEDGEVTRVNSGIIGTSSSSLTCYPLEMNIKVISWSFEKYYRKIMDLKTNSLNHPNIRREFENRWEEACETSLKGESTEEIFSKLHTFSNQIMECVRDIPNQTVDGIQILK